MVSKLLWVSALLAAIQLVAPSGAVASASGGGGKAVYIKINPFTHLVTEVTVEKGLEGFYKAMSNEFVKCECITAPAILDNEDTLFADDEGLFKKGNPL